MLTIFRTVSYVHVAHTTDTDVIYKTWVAWLPLVELRNAEDVCTRSLTDFASDKLFSVSATCFLACRPRVRTVMIPGIT